MDEDDAPLLRGQDAHAMVAVTRDNDARPIRVEVSRRWEEVFGEEGLGPAIVEAAGQASLAWLANTDLPRPEPATLEPAPHVSLDGIREMAERLRERLPEIAEQTREALMATHPAEDGPVSGRFRRGDPVEIAFDPDFLEGTRPSEIGRAVTGLLQREWERSRAHPAPLPGVQESMALQSAVAGPGGLMEQMRSRAEGRRE